MEESQKDINFGFWEKMKARMVVGFYKYGSWKDGRCNVDALKNVQTRIEKYKETGNTEWLVDAANFLMMEFTLPLHPQAHFKGTDSHEAPKIDKF